jgi:Flp pilus assembly protein TadG
MATRRPVNDSDPQRGRSRHPRGQALAELALVLPILMAMVGGAIDFARAYQASITLQSATRSAAEAAATESTDVASAESAARALVCEASQELPGFVAGAGGSITECVAPAVTVTFSRSTTAPGASTRYPLASATVESSLDFELLIPWPMLPNGTWDLGSAQSYGVIQGR